MLIYVNICLIYINNMLKTILTDTRSVSAKLIPTS